MNQKKNVCQDSTFKQLFEQHALHLRNYLRYKGAQSEQARDLMQEAFLRLWKACKKVAPHKAKNFLFTVAANLFKDEMKHQKYVQAYVNEAKPRTKSLTPEQELSSKEFQQIVEQTIANLPDNQRVVFLMNRVDGMTYAEIAEHLGLSVKAVEKRMSAALKNLKKLVDLI